MALTIHPHQLDEFRCSVLIISFLQRRRVLSKWHDAVIDTMNDEDGNFLGRQSLDAFDRIPVLLYLKEFIGTLTVSGGGSLDAWVRGVVEDWIDAAHA